MGTNAPAVDGIRLAGSPPVGLVLETPLGWIGAVAHNSRLTAVTLPVPTEDAAVAACGGDVEFGRPNSLLTSLADDLRRYFGGEPVQLGRHPVDLSGHPPFRRRALLAAREIRCGEIRTYGWIARRAGRPGAARAAGQAMSRNPIPLVIPCHRVIAAGGRLGGYGGGLDMKCTLLRLEGIDCDLRGISHG